MPRLGMLTPSSNTSLEPQTCAMLAGLDDVTVHFSRFPVTEIALSDHALAQFDDAPILRAAELLAHAKVDVIAWNGTSSGWLGFAADETLCRRITAATGIPATTSMLALNELLAALGVRRLGLVTPYLDDVQARIVANYAALGIACDPERHLGLQDNFSFAGVAPERIAGLVEEVAAAGPGRAAPDAVAIVCTNLRACAKVAGLEAATGRVVLDTIATVLWKSLALAGADPARVTGWGRLFQVPATR
ncbi:MAG: Asp/Glu/hydantoin racemase [Rhodospirillales bacterium]|nr:Asp/Glu/hydantoin racemase [Rhodospirillales bacterium]